jgi:alpha-L-arabinofuranosidase
VNGLDVAATNSFENPRAVDVRERKIETRDGGITLTLPAHSVTVLRGELKRS